MQFKNQLRERGINVCYKVMLSDRYLNTLYKSGRSSKIEIILSAIRRLAQALKANKYDVLWIEGELFPWLPASFEEFFIAKSPRVVFDYDDAIYLRYKKKSIPSCFPTLRNKIETLIRKSDAVIVANKNLHAFSVSAGAPKVKIIPTVVDWAPFKNIPTENRVNKKIIVGWIGTPLTSVYLKKLQPALSNLVNKNIIDVVMIGANAQDFPSNFKVIDWSEKDEAKHLFDFDVGIMPLPDNKWAQGKSGFKIIQYMAAGKAVIASPIGASNDLVIQGKTGFLPTSLQEWEDAIQRMALEPELRSEMGGLARIIAKNKYCTEAVVDDLANTLAVF